jgi:hypothetical protein
MKFKLAIFLLIIIASVFVANGQSSRSHVRSSSSTASAKTKTASEQTGLPVTPITFENAKGFDFDLGCTCGMGFCPFLHSGMLSFHDEKTDTLRTISIKNVNHCPKISEGTIRVDLGNDFFLDAQLRQIHFPARWASVFREGVSDTVVQDKLNLMDHEGHLYPIDPRFHAFTDSHEETNIQEGLGAGLLNLSGGEILMRSGFIDTKGNLVYTAPATTRELRNFSDGLAWFRWEDVGSEARWGALDKQFNVAIPPSYTIEPLPFSEGLAAVENRQAKWGFINKNNQLVIPAMYTAVFSSFRDGAAIVQVDRSRVVVIDKGNKIVKELPISVGGGVNCKRTDHFCEIGDMNGPKGLIDLKGNIVFYSPLVRHIGEFGDGPNGLAWASVRMPDDSERTALIDLQGHVHLAQQKSQF